MKKKKCLKKNQNQKKKKCTNNQERVKQYSNFLELRHQMLIQLFILIKIRKLKTKI